MHDFTHPMSGGTSRQGSGGTMCTSVTYSLRFIHFLCSYTSNDIYVKYNTNTLPYLSFLSIYLAVNYVYPPLLSTLPICSVFLPCLHILSVNQTCLCTQFVYPTSLSYQYTFLGFGISRLKKKVERKTEEGRWKNGGKKEEPRKTT